MVGNHLGNLTFNTSNGHLTYVANFGFENETNFVVLFFKSFLIVEN
jgi:hypothetical protein